MRLAGMGMNGLGIGGLGMGGLGISKSREKTKDLVTMLLSHGARAWRHSQPEAKIHLHVTSRAGRSPVRMKLR